MRSLLFLFLLGGCGDTGASTVSYPALAHGAPTVVLSGAWTVSLERARVALGPIYFCATETASESLCEVAVNELPRVVEIDLLSAVDQPLGEVRGTTGTIRSAMFDLGITWFPTQPEMRAGSPLGHSAHFEGRAEKAGVVRRFIADVDVHPQYRGAHTVNGARLSSPHQVSDPPGTLRVGLDTAAWLATVDYDDLDTLPGDPIVITKSTRAGASLATALIAINPTFMWEAP